VSAYGGSTARIYTVDSCNSLQNGRVEADGKSQTRTNDKENGAAAKGVSTNDSSSIARRRNVVFAQNVELKSDADSVLGSANDLMGSESLEWVDLSKVGSIFSHQGSSLYLRFGALCKFNLSIIVNYFIIDND